MTSRNVMERALAKLHPNAAFNDPRLLTARVEALRTVIQVEPVPQTNLLEVTARALSPKLAEQRTQAVIDAYVDYLKAERTKAIGESLEDINAEIEIARQPGIASKRAVVRLPRIGDEIDSVARLINKSAGDLGQIQEGASQENGEPLRLELSQIESVATELATISGDLQQVQDRVSGKLRPISQTIESPLSLELPKIESAVAELASISQGLLLTQQSKNGEGALAGGMVQSAMEREGPRLQRVTEDLDTLSGDLVRIQQSLQGEERQEPQAIALPLMREVPAIESMATELATLGQELVTIQGAAAAIAVPGQAFAGTASQAENIGKVLKWASRDLIRVPTASLDMTRQLSAIRNYLDTVADDLERIELTLGDSKARGLVLSEEELISFRRRSQAHALGLEAAMDDLEVLRSPEPGAETDINSYVRYGQLVRIEGQIRGAIDDLNILAADLAVDANLTSLSDGLTEIQDRVQESNRALVAIITDFRGLESAPDIKRERDAVRQAGDELKTVALSLDIATRQLRGLPRSGVGPLLEARLGAVTERLSNVRSTAIGASDRIITIGRGGNPALGTILDAALAEGLTVVWGRIQESNDHLVSALEDFEASRNAPGISQETLALQASRKLATIAVSLEIASRQLWSLMRGNMGPILEAELGFLAERLTTAQSSVKSASQRLDDESRTMDTGLAEAVAVVQERVQTSADSLEVVLVSLRAADNDPEAGDKTGATDRVPVGQASKEIAKIGRSLNVASRQLQGLLGAPIDPLKAGELAPLAQQLAVTEGNVAVIADRLGPRAQRRNVALANDLAQVHDRIEKSAATLWVTLPIQASHQLLSAVPPSEGASNAYDATRGVAVWLDIASRQLRGILLGSTDPVLLAELSSITERVDAIRGRVAGISRLLESEMNGDGADGPTGGFLLAQTRLEASASVLKGASKIHQHLSEESEVSLIQETIGTIKDRTDIGIAILGLAGDELRRIQTSESDPVRYGQLVVIEERVQGAATRMTEISAELGQLQGRQGPSYRDLLDLRQKLELSRLKPQDTGITIVDSAVLPVGTGRQRVITNSTKTTLPLGAAAGLLLGILAVLAKDHM
ncbi:MAG: hypothetical protein J4N84_15985, partial [Chloroflexi bacterium]|nr:hypothetical protein [Chloroflexota bacterium]